MSQISMLDGDSVIKLSLSSGHCSCGVLNCKHMKMALDYYRFGGKSSRFDFISAMHKEIRRGDHGRAFHYAHLLEPLYKKRFVRDYLRNIVFEETRNLSALQYIAHDWERGVVAMATSVKKWEALPRGHILKKCQSYLAAKKSPDLDVAKLAGVWQRQSFYDALQDLFRIRLSAKDRKSRSHLISLMLTEGDTNNPVSINVRSLFRAPSYYDAMMALMVHYGLLTEDSGQFYDAGKTQIPEVDILVPEAYCYDVHTYIGLSAMKRFWPMIKPGESLPGGLDLRWSGTVCSTLWRECAFDQYGANYRSAQWQDVKIPQDEWELARALDEHHYPQTRDW